MANKTKNRRRALHALALASVSMAAVATQAQAQSAPQPVTPRYGDIQPFYGDIAPFYGDISPFYGDISPFYGDISPFYGDITPFWGDINPFYGDISPFYGDISPFWGDINPFEGPVGKMSGAVVPEYGDIAAFWGDISPFWENTTQAWAAGDYTKVANKLGNLVDKSADVFGEAVKAQAGESLNKAVAKVLFAKYGIDLDDPSSLSKLTAADQAKFFLEWHDTLMGYAGVDQVDWWMKSANWTPALTQQQGNGADTTIGLLDFTISNGTIVRKNIIAYDGVSNFTNGHGAAVASLMVAAHDGVGVMGIAPKAKVVAYNPFDETGTAGWSDIKAGITMLATNKASIINMSLGVPGFALHPEWNGVFTDAGVQAVAKKSVFVVAAGNEGVRQKQDVQWSNNNPYLIVVGSVGLDGKISNFSNKPGNACLIVNGNCGDGDLLMDRFIVAPGELILVADDKGGVMRQTGTSLAAPLVSGAVALLHDRWPWLAQYPKETVNIILRSAKDLGEKGTDPVYGRGLLDITASQSPLNFNNLTWFEFKDGELKEKSASHVQSMAQEEKADKWNAKGMYFYAFEKIGGTQRDFAIPLAEKLIGQSITTASGSQEKFQLYLLSRLQTWADGASSSGSNGFSNGFTQVGSVANPFGAEMTLSIAPKTKTYGFVQEGLAYQSMVQVGGEKSTMRFGFGAGAQALNGQAGFAAQDFDSDLGGANPFLGLASGGAFAQWQGKVTDQLSISIGATQRSDKRDSSLVVGVDRVGSGAERYDASAQHVAARYALNDVVTLTGGYTRLKEASALLGVQSMDPSDFAEGTTTDGVSLGLDLKLSDTLSLSASGTRGRTRQNAAGEQNLAVSAGGVISTAYEVTLTKTDLFASGDRARFSLSQPMFVEKGKLDFTTVQVVDRTTGQLGAVTQQIDIAAQSRPYAAEFLYGTPVMKGAGEVALFGRAETKDGPDGDPRYMAGGRFTVRF